MRGQLRLNVHALLPALSRNGAEICGFVDTATFLVAVQSVMTECHKQGAEAMVRWFRVHTVPGWDFFALACFYHEWVICCSAWANR